MAFNGKSNRFTSEQKKKAIGTAQRSFKISKVASSRGPVAITSKGIGGADD